MASSPSGHCPGSGRLLLLAIVASLSTFLTSQDDNTQSTVVNCSSLAPSPTPSPSSFSTTNRTFWSNVAALLDALPSAAAPTGFASLSHGNGTDRAFVRGLCRGDSTPADCATYLQSAVLNIWRSSCNSSRRAGIWYDNGSGAGVPAPMFCFLSYADTNESAAYERQFRYILHNTGVARDKGAFENTYYALMSRLAARVVNGSGTTVSSSLPVALLFATGETVYYEPVVVPNGTMYGLVQCMRDRTAAECDRCLKDSIAELPKWYYGNQGAVVLGYNCYLCMEMYTFCYKRAMDSARAAAPTGWRNIQP